MSLDENDKHKAGTLPHDPAEGTKLVANEAPRILTVQDLLRGSRENSTKKLAHASVTTGNHHLDHITGGMLPGFVWVFGADTSWGKSSFLVMLADENIKRGRRVLIVSAEDSEKIYGDRLMLRRSRISADRLRKRSVQPDEMTKMLAVEANAEDAPVFLDARGRGVEWVARHVKSIIKEQEIDLVAYDYLQAFDNEQRQQDRRNQITYIARVLTDITKSLDRTGIIFSQLTIEKGKAIPDKHSIRESRDVSNAAEVVLLGFTPEKPITASNGDLIAAAGQRCLFVDKCKNGPRGAILEMPWDPESACFETVDDPQTKRFQDIADSAGNYDDFDYGRTN